MDQAGPLRQANANHHGGRFEVEVSHRPAAKRSVQKRFSERRPTTNQSILFSVFFKTIVMKICDIYPYLYAYLEMLDYVRLEDGQFNRQIFHYLQLINVQPPKDQEIRSSSKAKFKSMYESAKKGEYDLGQKVSRNLFNQTLRSLGDTLLNA